MKIKIIIIFLLINLNLSAEKNTVEYLSTTSSNIETTSTNISSIENDYNELDLLAEQVNAFDKPTSSKMPVSLYNLGVDLIIWYASIKKYIHYKWIQIINWLYQKNEKSYK